MHAKNLSIVREPTGEWRSSPAYDLPSTVVYGDLTSALDIGGEDTDLKPANFFAFATAIDLPVAAAQRKMTALNRGTAVLPSLIDSAQLPFPNNQLEDVKAELCRRRELLKA